MLTFFLFSAIFGDGSQRATDNLHWHDKATSAKNGVARLGMITPGQATPFFICPA